MTLGAMMKASSAHLWESKRLSLQAPWHSALCSIPWPGMTAFLCRTHGRRGQRSSCLGVMVPREEEESPSGHWRSFPCPTLRKLLADPVLLHTCPLLLPTPRTTAALGGTIKLVRWALRRRLVSWFMPGPGFLVRNEGHPTLS